MEACLFVTLTSIIPFKKAVPKTGIAYGYFAKSGDAVLHPFACGEIALENSVVHCCPRSSFIHASSSALH